MIEIKLSQGAKPGHGGILPASKNSPEIAEIRGLKAYTQVNSPSTHSAFTTPIELMLFIKKLRHFAQGKPVGIKIIASGKIFTGFHIIKRLCLGADLCNSARGMMLAMGCVQSLQCNANTCPRVLRLMTLIWLKGWLLRIKSTA